MRPDPALWLMVLLAAAAPAVALEGDANQPIEIEADTMTLDNAAGITRYEGSVRLTQGSITVTGERLTLRADNGRLEHMEILGSPATFEQQADNGQWARGRARRMEYEAGRSRLLLTGEARMRQGANHIESERIHYNTESNSLTAGKAPPQSGGDGERVRIIINPEQD